jgi:hypothetical protein
VFCENPTPEATSICKSLNPLYEAYDVSVNEIIEVWKFCNYLSSEIPDKYWERDKILKKIEKVEAEMNEIKKAL